MRIADCGLRINRMRISVYIPDLQFEIRNPFHVFNGFFFAAGNRTLLRIKR